MKPPVVVYLLASGDISTLSTNVPKMAAGTATPIARPKKSARACGIGSGDVIIVGLSRVHIQRAISGRVIQGGAERSGYTRSGRVSIRVTSVGRSPHHTHLVPKVPRGHELSPCLASTDVNWLKDGAFFFSSCSPYSAATNTTTFSATDSAATAAPPRGFAIPLPPPARTLLHPLVERPNRDGLVRAGCGLARLLLRRPRQRRHLNCEPNNPPARKGQKLLREPFHTRLIFVI